MSERMWLAEELEKARTARDRLARELEQAHAREAGLREALRPFADAHFYYNDAGKPDDCMTGVGSITYGDFRRVVSVLAALASEQQT